MSRRVKRGLLSPAVSTQARSTGTRFPAEAEAALGPGGGAVGGRLDPPPPLDHQAVGSCLSPGRAVVDVVDVDAAVVLELAQRLSKVGDGRRVEELVAVHEDRARAQVVTGIGGGNEAGCRNDDLITAADRWTDEFHVARRRKDMNLAAEIQWNLLPLAAVSTDRASLACALEPAYEVGGDAFDYSYGRRFITAGIFDAMGRGVNASRVSALGLAAFRNGRRCGRGLADQARLIHQTLVDRFDREGFMTGQLLAVELGDPERSLIVNAGHPSPLLQRDGDIERVELEIDFPFGMPFENRLAAQPLELRRGDRLILFSDGVVEARPDGGQPFGDARLVDTLQRLKHLPPREAARGLVAEVRAHRAGDLTDDATIIILDLPR